MVKKNLILSMLFLAAGTAPVLAQRQISSFEEYKKVSGDTLTIDGQKYYKPDIYYLPQSDGTYKALRFTVSPTRNGADITVPYLNMATSESIYVNWKTSGAPAESVVKYGLSPDELTGTCTATSKAITRSYHWNTARLTGLKPDTPYYYRVVSDGTESEIYRFRTKVAPGSDEKVRVLLIGDHQRNEHSDYEWLISAARQTVKKKYGDGHFEDYISFLLNDGDQVDGGYIDLYEKVHLFKSRYISPYLPNMTVVGNHEYKNDPDLSLYDGHYHDYASLEYKGITSGDAGYYAYQNGSVLFIALNSDNTSPEQKFWIRKVVAAADADNTVKFIVSVQHRPLYAEQYASDVSPWMLNEIMPILSSSPKHVLNIAGHHHLYARGQMTDTPVYHIITGGGVGTTVEGYEQLWGKTPDNRNQNEVQKTIDHWTYQILEFDPVTSTMTVECYSIGNSRLALDNELVDSFSRKVDAASRPDTPVIEPVAGTVNLPATFNQNATPDPIYTVQYQVATDEDFAKPLLDFVVNAEDFYGVTSDYLPLDINKNLDLRKLIIEEGKLANGSYFMRVRNRNSNLDWSDYSSPVPFTVVGAGDPATVAVDSRFYKTGTNIRFDYTGAPVNTGAWIGVYKENFHPGTSDLSTEYAYTSSDAGSCDMTINIPGAYFAVLFKDGGYTEISPRVYFVVSDNCDSDNPPALSTDKPVYNQGDPIVVKLDNAPCIQNDWIGLYDNSVTVVKDGKSHSYTYVGSDPDGEIALNVPGNHNFSKPVDDGIYYVTYCIDNEYFEPMDRHKIVVGKPVIIETAKAAYTPSEEIMVTYDGAPAWDNDRMTLFVDGECKSEFPMGSTGGTVNLGTLPSGDYEVSVTTVGGCEISPRAKFSVSSLSWMETLPNPASLDRISIVANGDIRADGNIEVYTFSGRLYATAVGRLVVTTPGIYIARAAGKAIKLVVK